MLSLPATQPLPARHTTKDPEPDLDAASRFPSAGLPHVDKAQLLLLVKSILNFFRHDAGTACECNVWVPQGLVAPLTPTMADITPGAPQPPKQGCGSGISPDHTSIAES